MKNPTEQIDVPARFLFRFAIPCRYRKEIWSGEGIVLEDDYTLPELGELEETPRLAEVRAAWNESGVVFTVEMTGKRKPAWCRASRLAESDGFHVWLDTRPTRDVHRATRFCHRFAFLPSGSGAKADQPTAGQLLINRAKEDAPQTQAEQIEALSQLIPGGYRLECYLPAASLHGFAPDENAQLGFTYLIRDSELGELTLTAGAPFPFEEDPSVWAVLDLVR